MNEPPDAPPGAVPRLWPFKNVYYGWAVVATSMLAAFAQVPMYGPVLSIFVKPIGDDTGWSRGEISVAFTIGSVLGAVASVAVGRQIDRYGARASVVVSGLLVTVTLVGLAFMQQLWHFWVLLGIGRTAALAGIGLGTSVAVANWFVRKRGRAVSLLAVGLRAGQSIFPLFIAPIIIVLSWRYAYGALAVIAFALIVVPGWLFLRRRPEDLGLLPDGDAPGPAGPEPASEGQHTSVRRTEVSWTLTQASHTRAFWLIIVALMLLESGQTGVNLHAVASFQDRGVADSFAGIFVFVFAGIAALSAYAWGALMDRYNVRWVALLATVLMAASLLVLIVADNLGLAFLFAVLYGLGTGGWTVAQVLLLANYFGRRHLGSIRGFARLASGPVGAAGPLMAGFLQTSTGSYTLSFQVLFGATVAVGVALFFAPQPTRPPAAASDAR